MESKLPEAESSEADQIQPEVPMDVDVVDHKPESDFKELFALLRREEKNEIAEANREILEVVRSLGGDKGKYRRERQRALKAVVSEIYSPPRVTAVANNVKLKVWGGVGTMM